MRAFLLAFLAIYPLPGFAEKPIVIGSKKFTESVVLGDIARLKLSAQEVPAVHKAEFGGTRILWNALLSGDIHAYPEYTGTIEEELLQKKASMPEIRSALEAMGIGTTDPLGFNNTYAVGMKRERAEALGISRISDLARHPGLVIGWSDEFRRRKDGWPGLRDRYGLPHRNVRGLDHDVAYRAIQSGDIEVMDLYSTDAEIEYYDLIALEDDLSYFPRYEALFLYRLEAARQQPQLKVALEALAGRIPEEKMIGMNKAAKIDRVPSTEVAGAFLEDTFGISSTQAASGRTARIFLRAREHLLLVAISLAFAILVAVPLGILAARYPAPGRTIHWVVSIIQTIPALALLVILIRPLNMLGLSGIGNTPALIALFLYSLLPIVRNTSTGLLQIPLSLRETALVLGLSPATRLLKIEFPLALPAIMAGIKTAAVMNVGFATLGALVGAGGFGQPILTGIRLDDYSLILEGAVPAAILAVVAQQAFDLTERALVSPGLKK